MSRTGGESVHVGDRPDGGKAVLVAHVERLISVFEVRHGEGFSARPTAARQRENGS
jgi:hypothetical protein